MHCGTGIVSAPMFLSDDVDGVCFRGRGIEEFHCEYEEKIELVRVCRVTYFVGNEVFIATVDGKGRFIFENF